MPVDAGDGITGLRAIQCRSCEIGNRGCLGRLYGCFSYCRLLESNRRVLFFRLGYVRLDSPIGPIMSFETNSQVAPGDLHTEGPTEFGTLQVFSRDGEADQ